MRAGAEGATTSARAAALGLAAAALTGCALFLSDGSAQGPLVALGAAALLAAALAAGAIGFRLAPAPVLPPAALAFLGCLTGLVVWTAASVAWSTEPSTSWQFANRVLAYLAFACVGVLLGGWIRGAPRLVAGALAALVAAVFAWALAAKAVPSLYPDYARLARLRSPVGYWNVLAVLADVGVALGFWLATRSERAARVRVAGAVLLYLVGVGVLLTYSRFGITIALLVSVGWIALERERVESLVTLALAAAPAIGVFGYSLTLPGITADGVTHAQRAHDGWRFGIVALAGAVFVGAVAFVLARLEVPEPLRVRVDRGLRVAGVVVAVAAVVLVAVFARRIWHAFSNPGNVVGQGSARLGSASSSNRWTWWQEAWHAFVRHPLGGTGGGTFGLTNTLHRSSSFDVAVEPHNVPLQFLSETGIVGLLLWLGVFAAAAAGIVRARAREDGAVTALALGLAAWLVHMIVDIDWSYVAVCGPLLLVAGVLLSGASRRPAAAPRRPLLALGSIALALAAVYALASPWLAQRELNRSENLATGNLSAAIDAAKAAHRYDPLSTNVLIWWAGLEDAAGRTARARTLYRDAIRTTPLDPDAWYELGSFEYSHRDWPRAYRALDRSWGLDRHGQAGVPCDYLDLVRPKVLGYGRKCTGYHRPA